MQETALVKTKDIEAIIHELSFLQQKVLPPLKETNILSAENIETLNKASEELRENVSNILDSLSGLKKVDKIVNDVATLQEIGKKAINDTHNFSVETIKANEIFTTKHSEELFKLEANLKETVKKITDKIDFTEIEDKFIDEIEDREKKLSQLSAIVHQNNNQFKKNKEDFVSTVKQISIDTKKSVSEIKEEFGDISREQNKFTKIVNISSLMFAFGGGLFIGTALLFVSFLNSNDFQNLIYPDKEKDRMLSDYIHIEKGWKAIYSEDGLRIIRLENTKG